MSEDRLYQVMFSVDCRESIWTAGSPGVSTGPSSLPAGAEAIPWIRQARVQEPRPVTLNCKGQTEATTEPEKQKDSREYTLDASDLFQCSLLDFQVLAAQVTHGQPPALEAKPTPIPGPDEVRFLQLSTGSGAKKLNMRLAVNVVEALVNPVHEAAYALLRWQQTGGKDSGGYLLLAGSSWSVPRTCAPCSSGAARCHQGRQTATLSKRLPKPGLPMPRSSARHRTHRQLVNSRCRLGEGPVIGSV